ncbi:MAG: ornithine carbamoyltransferase [Bacteroidota bacterium]
MHTKDFISIHDLTVGEVHHIFDLTREMKAEREKFSNALEGKILALIFEKPSLRTRVSFEVGIRQLGGNAVYLSPLEIQMGKRESIHDVGKTLERMVDGIMVRTFGHEIVLELAKAVRVPVINGLTDLLHPCQAMADYFTVLEKKRNLKGLKVVFVGDGNNVCHSLMFGAAKLGVDFWAATPRGYEPKKEIVQSASEDARVAGARLHVVNDPQEAVRDADVVYTDVWASMGQETEAEARKRTFLPYQVNQKLFSFAKPDALFLHCLPAHRGDEVTDDVIDSSNSVVFDEAENRLHVQKAILYELLR